MVHAIHSCHKTIVAYGQPHTKLVFSDKPAEDFAFFCNGLPGIMTFQRELDSMQNNVVSVECVEPVARWALNPQDVPFVRNSTDITIKIFITIKILAPLNHLKDLPIA
jgi:hypothetical protein